MLKNVTRTLDAALTVAACIAVLLLSLATCVVMLGVFEVEGTARTAAFVGIIASMIGLVAAAVPIVLYRPR